MERYLHISLTLKDLLTQGEEYLLVLKVQTEDQDLVRFYSILTYLGTNHVQDCVDFAQRFHEMTLTGDSDGSIELSGAGWKYGWKESGIY